MTTRGEPIRGGVLQEVALGRYVRVETEGGPREVAWDRLVQWGRFEDARRGPQVILIDGSRIVAKVLRIEAAELTLASRLWVETAVPRSAVRAVLFQVPLDTAARDRLLDRLTGAAATGDRLILDNGDAVTGQLVLPVQPEPGAFYPAALSWRLNAEAEPVEIALARVVALVLADTAAGAERPGAAVARVGFRDGSWLVAQDLTRQEDRLEVRLLGSIRLRTEAVVAGVGSPWEAVVFLQPVGGPVTYLSDLQPLGYTSTPYLSVDWPWRSDRSAAGTWLRQDGQVFARGVGMHGAGRLAYDLGGRYQEFQAELAIDERAGRRGSVVFRIFLQGAAGTWSAAYTSPVVRGGQAALPVKVNVQGAVRMALLVEYADRAEQWDHANWLNARLIP